MSLEKPSLSGSQATETNQEDPAVLLSHSWQEEESDWAADFLRAVNGTPSTLPDSQEDRKTSLEVPAEPHILPDEQSDITQIIEFKVPVSHDIQPIGSINVENLWTSNFASSGPTRESRGEPPASPPAEGPLSLSASVPEKPASTPSHPPGRPCIVSGPEVDFFPAIVSTPPMSPETRFLENHNIMKWVIDDQDEGDIPGLCSGISCPSESHAMPTSQSTPVSEAVTATPNDNFQTEENNDVKPLQRPKKRGRPLKTSSSVTPHKVARLQANLSTASTSDSETSLLTDDEVSALKYRRMRDLNNEASRRCRDRRRVNQENKERELEQHRHRNLVLRNECDILETKVRKIKNYILKSFKNPQQEIARAHLRRAGLFAANSASIGIFSDPRDLPEIDCSWLS